MEKIKDGKWLYVILSLLIASVLWLYVGNEVDAVGVQTYTNIPVTFTGVDRLEELGMTISSGMDQTVSVRIRARSSILKDLASDPASKIIVSVSMASISEPGPYSLEYRPSYRPSTVGGTAGNVDYISQNPQTIDIVVSRRSDQSVPVELDFTGGVAEGFLAGTASIVPSAIKLSGTEELVSQVKCARVDLSAANLSETFSREMPFTLYDFQDRPIGDTAGITTDVSTVKVTLPIIKTKEVPLKVEVVPGGGATAENAQITIEPETITVGGSPNDLEAINEIILSQIDLSEIFTSADYTFEIPLRDALTNISESTQAKVHMEITGLVTRTISVDNITFINVPAGYPTPTAITRSKQVQIRGTQEAVDAVLPSQLSAVVNCEGIKATGAQTVPVEIYLDGTDDVGVVGSDFNITISVTQ